MRRPAVTSNAVLAWITRCSHRITGGPAEINGKVAARDIAILSIATTEQFGENKTRVQLRVGQKLHSALVFSDRLECFATRRLTALRQAQTWLTEALQFRILNGKIIVVARTFPFAVTLVTLITLFALSVVIAETISFA